MGMFDYFNPLSLLCPHCGGGLSDFQGKPANPFLYVWQEHAPHPIEQRCDAEWRSARIHDLTLDENVAIYVNVRDPRLAKNSWMGQ